jgi:hypothetical protein
VVLRQEHKPGEKMFRRLRTTTPIYGPNGGPLKQAHLLVAVLSVSRVLFFY